MKKTDLFLCLVTFLVGGAFLFFGAKMFPTASVEGVVAVVLGVALTGLSIYGICRLVGEEFSRITGI